MAEFESSQLPLAVHLRPDAQLSSLYVEPNDWIIDWLKTDWHAQKEQFCWIDAGVGAGLSHLLQAIAQQAEQQRSVFYLSLASPMQLAPEVLADLPAFDMLCLDDVDAVLGQADWDVALLHCFNEMRAHHKQLVIGSHQALSDLQSVVLADLWSRLHSGLSVHWQRPKEWAAAIHYAVASRGLVIDDTALHYLAQRVPREWPKLMVILNQLDQAALITKRRMTIPFIRQVMGW